MSSKRSLTLVLTLAVLSIACNARETTLSDVCQRKWGAKVESIEHARQLFAEVSAGKTGGCSGEQLNAFRELKLILDPEVPADICSLETVDKFEKFHLTYISKDSSSRKNLPSPLRKFFIRLAMEVHQHCLLIMLKTLPGSTDMVSDYDHTRAVQYLNKDSLLGKILKRPKAYDDIALVTAVIDPNKEIMKERRLIIGDIDKPLRDLRSSCEKVFKPIYDKRVMPVYKLARLGYNYFADEEKQQFGPIDKNMHPMYWYRVTMLCDPLMFYDFAHDPSAGAMRVLFSQDAAQARKVRDLEPEKEKLVIAEDGDNKLEDKVFASESAKGLDRAVRRFSAKTDIVKDELAKLIEQLDPRASQVLYKNLIKRKSLQKGAPRELIDINKLMDEMREAMNHPPKPFIDPRYFVFPILALMPPLGWAFLIDEVLSHAHPEKKIPRFFQESEVPPTSEHTKYSPDAFACKLIKAKFTESQPWIEYPIIYEPIVRGRLTVWSGVSTLPGSELDCVPASLNGTDKIILNLANSAEKFEWTLYDVSKGITYHGITVNKRENVNYAITLNNKQSESYLDCNLIDSIDLMKTRDHPSAGDFKSNLKSMCLECGQSNIELVNNLIHELIKTKLDAELMENLNWHLTQLISSQRFSGPIQL